MLKQSCTLTRLLLAMFVVGVCAANDTADAQTSSAAGNTVEKEIRAGADAFVESFNQRNAAAIAAQFAPDGVYINEDGQRFAGRKAIQDEYETLFANNPGELQMQLEIDSIRLINPDTAIEEGRAAVVPQPPGQTRLMSQYMAVHVRKDGKWLVANVRDTRVELPPDYGQLEDLEGLVGTWKAGDQDHLVQTKCRWIENNQFLARTHSVTESGEVTATGLQIIGVNSSTGQVTSWSFSSDGGHAVGLWAPHPNGWMVESSGLMKDGTPTSATHILSRKDKDTVLWKSTNRTLGDTLLPDTPEVTLQRQ